MPKKKKQQKTGADEKADDLDGRLEAAVIHMGILLGEDVDRGFWSDCFQPEDLMGTRWIAKAVDYIVARMPAGLTDEQRTVGMVRATLILYGTTTNEILEWNNEKNSL